MIFDCRKTRLLWSVVLDKIDILAGQGAGFRAVIHKSRLTFLATLVVDDKQVAEELPEMVFAGEPTQRVPWKTVA